MASIAVVRVQCAGVPRPGRGDARLMCTTLAQQKLPSYSLRLPYAHSAASDVGIRSDTSTDPQTPVCTFLVKSLALQPGQIAKVVGSPPELGSWNVSAAPTLQWHEGNDWSLTAPCSATRFEFKLIVAHHDGDASPRWENGSNRAVQVQPEQSVQVVCHFDDPASTKLLTLLSGGTANTPSAHAESAAMTLPLPEQITPRHEAVHRVTVSEEALDRALLKATWAAAGVEAIWKTEGGGSLTLMSYDDA